MTTEFQYSATRFVRELDRHEVIKSGIPRGQELPIWIWQT